MSTVGNQTNFDTVLAVYTGSDVSTFRSSGMMTSIPVVHQPLTFTATAGVTYRIAVTAGAD
jgi:hypothetical protein